MQRAAAITDNVTNNNARRHRLSGTPVEHSGGVKLPRIGRRIRLKVELPLRRVIHYDWLQLCWMCCLITSLINKNQATKPLSTGYKEYNKLKYAVITGDKEYIL